MQLFGSDGNASENGGQASEPSNAHDSSSRKTMLSNLISPSQSSFNNLANAQNQGASGADNVANTTSKAATSAADSLVSSSGKAHDLAKQGIGSSVNVPGIRSSLGNASQEFNSTHPAQYISRQILSRLKHPLNNNPSLSTVTSGLGTIPDSAVLPHSKEFPSSFDLSEPSVGPGRQMHRPSESYSPRLSYANLHDAGKIGRESILKDDYQGFHKNPNQNANIPPLSQPIKPRFRKKGSLLGKLIHSNRKDLEGLMEASDLSDAGHPRKLLTVVSSGGSSISGKHKFRIPLISLHHHASLVTDASRTASLSEDLSDKYLERLSGAPSKNSSVSGPAGSPSKLYDLNLNMEELSTIVKPGTEGGNLRLGDQLDGVHINAGTDTHFHCTPHVGSVGEDSDTNGAPTPPGFITRVSSEYITPDNAEDHQRHSAWKAPDSWDVTESGFHEQYESDSTGLSDIDQEYLQDIQQKEDLIAGLFLAPNQDKASQSSSAWDTNGSRSGKPSSSAGPEKQRRQRRADPRVDIPEKKNTTVFGIEKNFVHNMQITKGPKHIVRIFREDNTFSTMFCALEETTAELLTTIQRKLFLDLMSNFQLTLYYGLHTKVLDLHEKPAKIQLGLLTTQGYEERDNLQVLGRGDMLSIYRFVIENISLRSRTEEQTTYAKTFVDVHISGLGLKIIPIIFHQHTFEIEKLDVSHNPALYIPLDFIQSCSNLSVVNFLHNGCLRFPHNLLEAPGLLELDVSNNFLSDIPARCLLLRNLKTLRLNSNQLHFLHSNFSRLSNLTSLNLALNYFQTYPECINNLTALQELDLSYNDLSALPASIGKLVRLTKLNLCSNRLSNALPPVFTRLGALKRLDIRYNFLTNIDVLDLLPNLEVLYASKNDILQFSDKMQALRLLRFDRNPVTTLEFEILLPMLTVLDLSKAKIAAIPADFVLKIANVENLVLDKNHIVTLPDEIGQLKKLLHLSVYDNNIQVLPALIGQLLALQYLDLHLNNLECLPCEIWRLGKLAFLNVSLNILASFPLPPDSQRSKPSLSDALLTLYIADNRLKEEAFEALSLLVNLTYLNVLYNDFVEVSEGALLQLVNLVDLRMLGNNLTKLPADAFENLTALRSLFVNNNKLLTIPPELSNCKLLTHLDVGSNHLRYNISNWPYDWNWCHNKNLKYLNFSGNKRFEIKQSYSLNSEKPGADGYDSLLVLDNLRVLGLMDVTLTTPNVPDQSVNMRVRTTSSELKTVGYGVSDCMGMAEVVLLRDSFQQKFRGNDDEVLICSFDGYDTMSLVQSNSAPDAGGAASISSSVRGTGNLVLFICKQSFPSVFKAELERINSDEDIQDALRRAFLALNREINLVCAAKRAGTWQPPPAGNAAGAAAAVAGAYSVPELLQLSLASDMYKGCCMAVVYIKKSVVYTANVGNMEILLLRSNTDYTVLSTTHDPTLRVEFERIRLSGGYVSGDGALDLTLPVLRGIGFFGYVPHTNGCPSTARYDFSGTEAVLIVALAVLWDYILHDLAVDIVRQEKDDPIRAAEKLRDHALCYGAADRISVTVVSVGLPSGGQITKKGRRDRSVPLADNALRRLNIEIDPPVGNIALVFTDIKNSTLLWDTYPVPMRSAIKLHNTIMRRQLRIVGGYEVKTEGDLFMVSFPSPASALLWCFNVQSQLLVEDWPTEILATNEGCEVTDHAGNIIFRGLSVRMGIHWGSPVCEPDMVTRRMDYFGPMVNRASRIESSADGGQIAVSSDFRKEMDRVQNLHEKLREDPNADVTAYYESRDAYNVTESELAALRANPYLYVVLGERKLKGLEAPETITLIFPDSLKIRYDIFRMRDAANVHSNSILGAVPVDAVHTLRSLSLRLENICLILNTGYDGNDDLFLRLAGDIFVKSLSSNFREKDIIGLFNHLVTRVENCAALLELRRSYDTLHGGDGRIDFTGQLPIWDLIHDISAHLGTLTLTLPSALAFSTV